MNSQAEERGPDAKLEPNQTPDALPTVFLVDDDASFLTATSRLMRASGYQVRSFGSPTEFLKNLPPDTPGCAILDLQMPGMDGLELQEAISKSNNPLPIIILTGQGDIPATVRAMRRGAEDFLTKRASKEQLLGAVERALARDARERASRRKRNELRDRFAALTARECEVLSHVLSGQMNKEIAADLGLNERSVKLHRTSITSKLGVQSVAELASLAQQAGLFENGQFLWPSKVPTALP